MFEKVCPFEKIDAFEKGVARYAVDYFSSHSTKTIHRVTLRCF